MATTIEQLDERLRRIEAMTLVGMKEALNTREAALLLGISEGRVRHLASEHRLPYYKDGSRTYYRKSELEDMRLKHRIATDEEVEAEAAAIAARRTRTR